MEVVTYQKYLRTSPKKMKGLGQAVSGLFAYQAVDRLGLLTSKPARILSKVLKSAIANGKNNNKLDPNTLVIKTIEVLKGPAFKRWQPVSRGMAHPIKKRTTHLRVVLMEKQAETKKIAKVEKVKKELKKKDNVIARSRNKSDEAIPLQSK